MINTDLDVMGLSWGASSGDGHRKGRDGGLENPPRGGLRIRPPRGHSRALGVVEFPKAEEV